MAYDPKLAGRVRASTRGRTSVTEKQMFGGVAFLLDGKMFCGIVKSELMVRVGPERQTEALLKPGARTMDFTGRPMRGYVLVAPEGCRTAASLAAWVKWGADFAATLPAKKR